MRTSRDDLAGEHRLSDIGQVVFACLFAAVWIADTSIFKCTVFLGRYVPVAVRLSSAAALMSLSGYLAVTGLWIVFGRVREKPAVIRRGPFAVVRHPVYLSEILLYLGFLMLSISLAAAAVWLVAIAFLHYISRHEEKLLLARFGTEYRQYMSRVPMWIPRLRRK